MTDDEKPPKKRTRGKPRRRGAGSVFQRPDRTGKQWVAQIILENGRTRQRYFKTQAEAEEALTDMLYEQRRGTLVTARNQTLEQHLEHWLEHVHRHTVRLATYVEYRRILDKHLFPSLGSIRLQQLSVRDVEAFYAQKRNEGLSPSSIRVMHAVLRQALDHAVRSSLVVRNVADAAKKALSRRNQREIHPLTEAQAQAFIAAAKGHRLEALFTMAIVTGMREGELLALRWSDLDLERGSLQVRRTVKRVRRHGLVEGPPKTSAGKRHIALSPFLVGVLKAHRVRQLEERLKAGAAWQEHELVFCTRFGGFVDSSDLTQMFRRVLRAAGLPTMRFHDLRHSAASLLLAMGVHAKVVQELLGHSNITMTLNIYSHVLPSLQKDAVDRLSGLFERQEDDKQANE